MTREQVEGWRQRLLFAVSHPFNVAEVNKVFDLALAGLDAPKKQARIEALEEAANEFIEAHRPLQGHDQEEEDACLEKLKSVLGHCSCGHQRGWHRDNTGSCLECGCLDYKALLQKDGG